MGPAQSGKSTLLRSLNRMTDLIPGVRREGVITLDGKDIHDPDCDPSELRRRVGMVFDTPVPLSRSIYENIVFGPRLKGIRDKATLDRLVEKCLQAAILWDEVKDRLQSRPRASPAASSSGCASPGPWRWSRRCCCWTSPPRASTRSRRSRSRRPLPN